MKLINLFIYILLLYILYDIYYYNKPIQINQNNINNKQLRFNKIENFNYIKESSELIPTNNSDPKKQIINMNMWYDTPTIKSLDIHNNPIYMDKIDAQDTFNLIKSYDINVQYNDLHKNKNQQLNNIYDSLIINYKL